MSASLWRLHLSIPPAAAQPFAEALEEHVDSLSVFEVTEGVEWTIDAICQDEPDRPSLSVILAEQARALGVAVPVMDISQMPQVDWLAENFASFKPIRAGRFFVHGSHYKDGVPADAIGLQIDAAIAFGSGEHGTTAGCLMALDRLYGQLPEQPHILDMGCGSGILAIAAAKLWNVPAAAVDIDEDSVRVAAQNAMDNGVGDLIHTASGDGYATPLVAEHGPYDLILANILARPLADMAPDLARWLKPGGYAVLSGLLNTQEELVLDAHTAQGLKLVERFPLGEWMTLVMRR